MKKALLGSACAVLLAIGLCSAASANISIEATSGGSTLGPATGASPPGTVALGGSAGNWTVSATGLSLGPATVFLDLSSITATATAPTADLHVLLTDVYTTNSTSFTLKWSGLLSTGAGTATVSFFLGATAFAETTPIDGPKNNLASATSTVSLTANQPYFLTIDVLYHNDAASGITTAFSTDSNIVGAVPLPGALPLLATGLVGLWGLSRRRKARGRLDSALAS